MKQIRTGVFETNSSSSHSISIWNDSKKISESELDIDYNGNIAIQFGEFGWGPRTYTDQLNKFKYLCTMWWILEGVHCTNINDIFLTEGFIILNDTIKEHCKCKNLYIDKESGICLEYSSYENKHKFAFNNAEYYIDHQSVPYSYKGDKVSLKTYLKGECVSALEFIFSPDVELIIDNDNH